MGGAQGTRDIHARLSQPVLAVLLRAPAGTIQQGPGVNGDAAPGHGRYERQSKPIRCSDGATYLIETQQWDLAGKIFSMVGLNYMVHQTTGGSSAEHMSHRYGGGGFLVGVAEGEGAGPTRVSRGADN